MKQHTLFLSLVLMLGLGLSGVSAAYGAVVDAAEGVSVNKVGEFNAVSIIYGDEAGRGISIGVNYTLSESAVAVTEKPEGAKVEAYFAPTGLKDFNSTGRATLMAYSDTPGKVTASILLKFTNEQTQDVKFVTGTVEMNFRDPTEIPQGPVQMLIFNVGSDSMIGDGQIYPLDQAPFIDNDRLYVPLRAVGDAFGLAVVYNEESGYIRLSQQAGDVVLRANSPEVALSDGTTLQMDVPVLLRDDRALLPARFIAQILGYEVSVSTGDTQATTQVMISR